MTFKQQILFTFGFGFEPGCYQQSDSRKRSKVEQRMPLFYQYNQPPDFELAIWQIAETEKWFLERLRLEDTEAAELADIKGDRRRQWLAARYMLSNMLGGTSGAMIKDEYGKPHLKHLPLHISLSHSHGLATVMVTHHPTGVDIQKLVPKIERIAHRVLRPEELNSLQFPTRIEHLHVYWGAKESLYKAYGRRELDFRQHMCIEPFAFAPDGGHCRGHILKEDYRRSFDIYYQQIQDFILVYALQIP